MQQSFWNFLKREATAVVIPEVVACRAEGGEGSG